TTGIWECPDLFRVPIVGSPGRFKWVFMMSPAPLMQYFVGEFDGTKFINESSPDKIYRPDYGPDYYASIVYNNLPPGTAPISIGWANNWKYAGDIPAGDWRGTMSLPRSLSLKRIGAEWILLQNPVDELASLKNKDIQFMTDQDIVLDDQSFMLEWQWKSDADGIQEMKLGESELVIRYDAKQKEVSLDRSGSAGFDNAEYRSNSIYKAVFPGGTAGNLKFRLYFDESIAELYVGDGEVAMTMQVFAAKPMNTVKFVPSGPGQSVLYRDLNSYR
ncbi:MAG TPA: GH32 C-terminal domain-containing protein, partial [Chitinophagaceae bacterium]|nr:GH32 C-terminal domain-containing protein [Chitinophagaceae bacterium]